VNVGADWSFVESPEKLKLNWPEVALAPALVPVELPMPDGLSSIQGTATCLPDALEVELLLRPEELLGVVELPGVELLLVAEPVPVELVSEVPPVELEPLLELSDTMAKSIRPDIGLISTSSIVPKLCPELPVSVEPLSWLAFIS
jgi:hypothetical protein